MLLRQYEAQVALLQAQIAQREEEGEEGLDGEELTRQLGEAAAKADEAERRGKEVGYAFTCSPMSFSNIFLSFSGRSCSRPQGSRARQPPLSTRVRQELHPHRPYPRSQRPSRLARIWWRRRSRADVPSQSDEGQEDR